MLFCTKGIAHVGKLELLILCVFAICIYECIYVEERNKAKAGKWYMVVNPSSLNQRNRTKKNLYSEVYSKALACRIDDWLGRRDKVLRKGRLELAGTGRVSSFSGKLSSAPKAPGQTGSSPPRIISLP